MATAIPGQWGESGDPVIDALTSGYDWSLGPDRTVHWAVSGGFDAAEFWGNPADVQAEMAMLFALYSSYANIQFDFLGYFASPQTAAGAGSDITVSPAADALVLPNPGIWASASPPYPFTPTYEGGQGDILVNLLSQAGSLTSYAPGAGGWFMLMNAIGTTLGLKNPQFDEGGSRATLPELALAQLNGHVASVMSYGFDQAWDQAGWLPATPMILDVLALQYLYGPNMQANPGDDAYLLARRGYDYTIWDPAGHNQVDVWQSAEAWMIMLPSVQLSPLVATKVGLAMPLADTSLATPQSLTWLAGNFVQAGGSPFGDVIVGNELDNLIAGGGGNDTIDGGNGIDTAVFGGTADQFRIDRNGDGSVTVSGPSGVSTLTNVERLVIGVTHIALDVNGSAGEAYRLYQAAFDRAPDAPGLGFQMHFLDEGASLSAIAANFIASPEFQQKYGSVDDTQFITLLYQNVLHRAPDPGGLQFHLGELAQGESRADLLVHFSESPENQANVIGAIEHGIVFVPF